MPLRPTLLAACTALILAPMGVAVAQDSTATGDRGRPAWQFTRAVDDMTNKGDARLTVSARDSVLDPAGRPVRPRLILACGDLYRGNGRKSLVVETEMPVAFRGTNLGMNLTDILVRFDTDEKPDDRRVQLLASKNGFYLGDFNGFFFSKGSFKKMLSARELRVRFMPLLGSTPVTVTFPVAELTAAMAQMPECDWPK